MALTKNTHLVPIIIHISYQLIKNVNAITIGSTAAHKQVTFKDGHDWIPFYFSPGMAKYNQKITQKDAGKAFEHTLSCKYPGESSENNDELESLDRLPIIVNFEYSTGVTNLMGSLQYPCYFSDDFSSDSERTDDVFTIINKNTQRLFNYEESA